MHQKRKSMAAIIIWCKDKFSFDYKMKIDWFIVAINQEKSPTFSNALQIIYHFLLCCWFTNRLIWSTKTNNPSIIKNAILKNSNNPNIHFWFQFADVFDEFWKWKTGFLLWTMLPQNVGNTYLIATFQIVKSLYKIKHTRTCSKLLSNVKLILAPISVAFPLQFTCDSDEFFI